MKEIVDGVVDTALDVVDDAQQIVNEVESVVEAKVAPMRRGLVHRFPTLFLLAVTFGVSLTFFGIDNLLSQSEYLSSHPWISLFFGVGILALTGTLYRTLSQSNR